MKVCIYTIPGCKACVTREGYHEDLAQALAEDGIVCELVEIGEIDGKTYVPVSEHDSVCRRGDTTSYATPTYLVDTGVAVAKLADPSKYGDSDKYKEYIKEVIMKINS